MYRNYNNFQRIFDIITRSMGHEAFYPYQRHLRPRNYYACQPQSYNYNEVQIETSKASKDGKFLKKIKKTLTNPDGSQDVYEQDINDKGYYVKQYKLADGKKFLNTTQISDQQVDKKSDLEQQKAQEQNVEIKAENLKCEQKLSGNKINEKDFYAEILDFDEFLNKFEQRMRKPFDSLFDDTFSRDYRHGQLKQATKNSENNQPSGSQQQSPELDKSGSYSFSREVSYNEDGSQTVKEYYEDSKGQRTKEYKITKDTQQQKSLSSEQ